MPSGLQSRCASPPPLALRDGCRLFLRALVLLLSHGEKPKKRRKKWTPQDDELLRLLYVKHGAQWSLVTSFVPGAFVTAPRRHYAAIALTRTTVSASIRPALPCSLAPSLHPSTPIAGRAVANGGQKRCRERWINHLDSRIKKTSWSDAEDSQLTELFAKYGSPWNLLAKHFIGRSEIQIKNRCNTKMRKAGILDDQLPAAGKAKGRKRARMPRRPPSAVGRGANEAATAAGGNRVHSSRSLAAAAAASIGRILAARSRDTAHAASLGFAAPGVATAAAAAAAPAAAAQRHASTLLLAAAQVVSVVYAPQARAAA